MWLIVGLGNPGREYARHRHNAGFMTIDLLAEQVDADPFRSKFSGEIARARLKDDDALLLKPMTYMNCSGDSVQPCAAFYKIPPENIVVIHDDLDIPFGEVRLKMGGGHGGNNGLRSLIQRLATPDFARIRVGIGRPTAGFKGDPSDWVLSAFSSEERENLPTTLKQAAKSVLEIAARGFPAAMKTRNTRPKKKKPKPKTQQPARPTEGGSGEPTAETPES
jgi:PTH1 family peptidyl-tRNA hydrolase